MRDYLIVTAAYWVFTLTDGALRMLVLLHLHDLGYTPLTLAGLFLFYEAAGVVTNFGAGWLGARFGLKSTLWTGLSLQILATSTLAWQAAGLELVWVIGAQTISGVAKDLTKMSAKSYVRLLVPEDDHHRLLHWVAVLTGSKNTLKGAGFFLGGLLLTTLGFRDANLAMAGALALALLVAVTTLPRRMGRAASPPRLSELFGGARRIQRLAVARLFLFGARDAWFVIGLPVFLAEVLGWSHAAVGGTLAAWVIGYGLVQASAPRLFMLRRRADARVLGRWTASLLLPLLGIAAAMHLVPDSGSAADATAATPVAFWLLGGLAVFGLLFAANSALHSFLILAYSDADRIALRVGYYYMANAVGRFLGTLASGIAYQAAGGGQPGLVACLLTAAGFVLASMLGARALRRAEDDPLSAQGSLD